MLARLTCLDSWRSMVAGSYWRRDRRMGRLIGSGRAGREMARTHGLALLATSGTAPLAVSFTDTSTGSPTSWSWSFGDGTSSTVQNPSKTYAAAGTYTVSLTASNSVDSDTATAAGYITVNNPASITRQGTSTTVNTTATPSINIAKPSGTVAGDVLVSCLASNGTKVAATGIPAGWTQIAAVLQGTSTRAFGYYKVAGASEPASYTLRMPSIITELCTAIARFVSSL